MVNRVVNHVVNRVRSLTLWRMAFSIKWIIFFWLSFLSSKLKLYKRFQLDDNKSNSQKFLSHREKYFQIFWRSKFSRKNFWPENVLKFSKIFKKWFSYLQMKLFSNIKLSCLLLWFSTPTFSIKPKIIWKWPGAKLFSRLNF